MGQNESSEADVQLPEKESEPVQQFRAASFSDVEEARETFVELFGVQKMTLTLDEFDQVFGPLLGDVEPHFQIFQSELLDTINVFEVFAGAILLSTEQMRSFDSKVEAIFKLFDFDNSETLNQVEIEVMFQACALGLSKILGIKKPSNEVIEEEAQRLFNDHNNHLGATPHEITMTQFKEWLANQAALLRYLGHFTEARLIWHAQQSVHEALDHCMDRFRALAKEEGDSSAKPYLRVARLAEVLRGIEGTAPTEDEEREFLELLSRAQDDTGKIAIDDFETAVESWVIFGILDEDGSRSLDLLELKALIWIHNGIDTPEPLPSAVEAAMAELDDKGTGLIDRMQWVRYNAGFDASTGEMLFSHAMREEFEALDADGSGTITADEMREIIAKRLQSFLNVLHREGKTLHTDSLEILHDMITSLASELVMLMDDGGNGMVEWPEFRQNQQLILDRVAHLKNYVITLAMADA